MDFHELRTIKEFKKCVVSKFGEAIDLAPFADDTNKPKTIEIKIFSGTFRVDNTREALTKTMSNIIKKCRKKPKYRWSNSSAPKATGTCIGQRPPCTLCGQSQPQFSL